MREKQLMSLESVTIELREAARTLSRVIVALEEIELQTIKEKLQAKAEAEPEKLQKITRAYLAEALPDAERLQIMQEHNLQLPEGCTRLDALQAANERDRAAIAAFGGLQDDARTEISDDEANELICGLLDIIDALVDELDRKQ